MRCLRLYSVVLLLWSGPALAESPVLTREFCTRLLEESQDVAHVPAEDVTHVPDTDVNLTPQIKPTLRFEIPVTVDVAEDLDLEIEAEAPMGTLRYEEGSLYFNDQKLDDTNARLTKLCDDIIWNRVEAEE